MTRSEPTARQERTAEALSSYTLDLLAFEDKAKRTVETYRGHIAQFDRWLETHHPDVTLHHACREHVVDYVRDLQRRGLSVTMRRLAVFSLRSFYRWADIDPDPTRNVRVPRQRRSDVVPYKRREVVDILRAARQRAADAKTDGDQRMWLRAEFDLAVLATFTFTGVRLNELINIRRDGLALAARELHVVGKGNRPRVISLPAAYVDLIGRYVTDIRPLLPDSDYLFPNPEGYPGARYYGRISPRALSDIARRYGELAGVQGRNHPHRFRHSLGTEVVKQTGNVESVRRLLGHQHLQTSLIYVHLAQEDVARSIEATFDGFSLDEPDPPSPER